MSEHEIECPDCNGYGHIMRRCLSLGPGLHEMTCEACNGHGWRAMTDDEEADAAEDQYRMMMEGEPPLSMQEAYERSFEQRQELKR